MTLLDLPKKLIKSIKQNRIYWKWLIIIPVFIAAIAVSQPLLWPDGFGIKADKSVTLTVEKDSQGKITKTVETTKKDPGKTLWDWLSLLGVPITLAILGYGLQQIQQKRAEKVAKEQRELAADETKEEVLQLYFDRLSTLLIDKNLLAIAAKVNVKETEKSATPEEQELLASAVDVIRARTLSILRRFENDQERKTSVIRFLIEADFISKLELNLSEANLSGANLSRANLSRANLSRANLSRTNLSKANIREVDLSGAILSGADLNWANLIEANLSGADLSGTNFSGANLSGAILNGAILSGAILNGAELNWAELSRAELREANLSGANLNRAELSGAVFFSSEQIKSARNWESALYDGNQLDAPEIIKQLGLDTKA